MDGSSGVRATMGGEVGRASEGQAAVDLEAARMSEEEKQVQRNELVMKVLKKAETAKVRTRGALEGLASEDAMGSAGSSFFRIRDSPQREMDWEVARVSLDGRLGQYRAPSGLEAREGGWVEMTMCGRTRRAARRGFASDAANTGRVAACDLDESRSSQVSTEQELAASRESGLTTASSRRLFAPSNTASPSPPSKPPAVGKMSHST